MSGHSALTKNWGKSIQGFCLRMPKHVLFFSVTKPTHFLATYPSSILTIFETKDVNLCMHECTGENFPNFCGGFEVQKQLKMVIYRECL